MNRQHNENQSNNIDNPVEPNFSETSTNIVAVYPKWLHMVETENVTVIQKKPRK